MSCREVSLNGQSAKIGTPGRVFDARFTVVPRSEKQTIELAWTVLLICRAAKMIASVGVESGTGILAFIIVL